MVLSGLTGGLRSRVGRLSKLGAPFGYPKAYVPYYIN